ncbi:hypothetical protein MWH28_11420 [Natroniella sulfidigena]|uniref:hypothetical protein n=1 Tax=Natroniella sulfidigena TaxID=723921 RepID=UPI00200A5236|nr:hypothetical protein [Natroniella sulfidigena]MCK8817966.1 hypothetical protein [Natroniella sulfidigena]
MKELKKLTEDYFINYNVPDLINQESMLTFILESPHTQEMKHGYPVAGSSGVEMTKNIYGEQSKEPFGKLVSQKEDYQKQYQNLSKFSILNVAPAPMQEGGLKEYDLSTEEQRVIAILEKLRTNYKSRRHQKEEWNQVKEVLLVNFKERLVEALNELSDNQYLVPCGKLADAYLNLVKNDSKLIQEQQIIEGIPHPSFNQWSYNDAIDKLTVTIKAVNSG